MPDNDPLTVNLTGRIVNLGITCTLPKNAKEHRCLLFKLEGKTECKFYSDQERINPLLFRRIPAPKTKWASKYNCVHPGPVIFGISNSSLAISYSEAMIGFYFVSSSVPLTGMWFIES